MAGFGLWRCDRRFRLSLSFVAGFVLRRTSQFDFLRV
jgi:hypothetical protein